MRKIVAAGLVAMGGMLAAAPAQADWVPPFKGNDTGGIIAYYAGRSRPTPASSRSITAPRYGKVVKFLGGARRMTGGYISFACRWVPYGAAERPLRVRLLSRSLA